MFFKKYFNKSKNNKIAPITTKIKKQKTSFKLYFFVRAQLTHKLFSNHQKKYNNNKKKTSTTMKK